MVQRSHVPGEEIQMFQKCPRERGLFLGGEPDSRFMEGNHKVPLRELAIQVDQSLVGSFVPVLGWTP